MGEEDEYLWEFEVLVNAINCLRDQNQEEARQPLALIVPRRSSTTTPPPTPQDKFKDPGLAKRGQSIKHRLNPQLMRGLSG